MRGRWLLNLALLALVAVLAALAWWPQRRGAEPPAPPLAAVQRDAVRRIEIVRGDDTLLVERDEGGRWWLAGTPRLPADGAKVESVLGLAATPSEQRYPVADLDLTQFGLDPPRVTLRLGEAELALGDAEPISGRRYIRVGDTLHLVSTGVFATLTAGRDAWISPQLVPEGAELEAVRLPDGVTVRRTDGGWAREPQAEGVGEAALADFADGWRLARAFEAGMDADPPPAGEVVTLVLEGLGERRFVIVQREPELVLRRLDLPVRYRFTRFTAERLLAPPKGEAAGGKASEGRESG
ncbi:uncharacterized protein DUF4340 [Inmirania thermothiophila]|uniref:Uncharacterized protein DUF4340 n=2 Tax=Inmirania thermothiophila TaxID=1750597 RepID=A0A3N1Y638_9GAMM|nr:uncharacterized protein DUF4340 [Inmirania thermothiophila]